MSAVSTWDNGPTRVEDFVGGMFAPTQTDIYPELHELLSSIPSDVGDGEWEAVLAAVHSASGGSVEGLKAIDDWSPLGGKRKSGAVLETWASLEGGEGGMTALARIAERYGANITEIGEKHGSLTHLLAELPDIGDFDISHWLKDDKGAATPAAAEQPNAVDEAIRSRADQLIASAIRGDTATAMLDIDYLIKDWLGRGDLSVLYGPSNVGKSFVALDIANHVAKSEEWNGRKVRGGPVIYFALEGGRGLQNRLAALQGGASKDLFLVPVPIDLHQSENEVYAITQAIEALSGGSPALIVFDTLARAMPGGDENTGVDLGRIIKRVDQVRAATGAHVMLVHHSGKDPDKGARGHSSLRGAIDTELRCEGKEGTRTLSMTKQRDEEIGGSLIYDIVPFPLGVDSDGDEKTTGTVVYNSPSSHAAKHKLVGRNHVTLMKCAERLSRELSEVTSGPESEHVVCGIDKEALLSAAVQELGKASDKAGKRAASDALKDVLKRGALIQDGTLIYLPASDDSLEP